MVGRGEVLVSTSEHIATGYDVRRVQAENAELRRRLLDRDHEIDALKATHALRLDLIADLLPTGRVSGRRAKKALEDVRRTMGLGL